MLSHSIPTAFRSVLRPRAAARRARPSQRARRCVAALLLLAALPALAVIQAMPGKDGAGGTLNTVVNAYWPGAASVSAGSTSISLGTRRGAAVNITAGDLLLVIQMQGADIDSSDTSAYGDGVAGQPATGQLTTNFQAGTYEYVIAQNTVTGAGGTVTVTGGSGGGLLNSYFNAAPGSQGRRTFQVVRVPQYTSATFGSGLTAPVWNGSTGGVLAVDVQNTLTLGGNVSVAGGGFRGGGSIIKGNVSGTNNFEYRTLSTVNHNASKGEGVAGTPRYVYDSATNQRVDLGVEGYPNGSFAAGAPGNAGGGGNDHTTTDHNAGGGGGGNAGAGGRGGRAWNPNTLGSEIGGFGGAAMPIGASRMFMGGGGGAGSRNDTDGPLGSGAAGGGIVMVRTGSIAGTGTVTVDGALGLSSANEGAGGGGAGGSFSLIVYDGGAATGLTVNARGGNGGNTWPTQPPPLTNAHGPGGGGGGGTVISNVTIGSVDNSPGDNGTSLTTQEDIGEPGQTSAAPVTVVDPIDIPGTGGGGLRPSLTTSDKVVADLNGGDALPNDSLRFTITLRERAGVQATGVRIQDTLSPLLTLTGVDLSAAPGAVDNSSGNAVDVQGITVPAGGDVVITIDAAISGSAQPGDSIDNAAQISSAAVTAFTVASTTVTVASSSVPSSGIKPLYLNIAGAAPVAIQRALPTIADPAGTWVDLNRRSEATWTLAPNLASNLVITPGGTIQVLLYLTAEGSRTNRPRDMVITLERASGSPTTIASVTANNVGMGTNGNFPTPVLFDLAPTAGATVTPGQNLRLRVRNNDNGNNRRLRVYAKAASVADDFDSRSKVLVPASTVINVDSVQFYSSAWAGTTVPAGGVFSPDDPLYVRATVSDPFGSADITGATLTVSDATGAQYLAPTAMPSVATIPGTAPASSGKRIYEYQLAGTGPGPGPLPPLGPIGFWSASVTADEGAEGQIDHTGIGTFELGLPDFVILKSSVVFSDPVNLQDNPKRIPGSQIDYSIQVSNQGRGRPTSGSLVVTDTLPAGLQLAVDSGNGTPFTFTPQTSGVTFAYPAGVTWNLTSGTTPVDGDGDGFFDNVAGFSLTPSGRMVGNLSGTAPRFTVAYRTRLQ